MTKLPKYFVLSLFTLLPGVFPSPLQAADSNPAFTQQELDQMLAPVALYPDALLAQILMAATYPLEVVQAARWSAANPSLKGDAAVQAVAGQNWDPSVKSLVAFPQVLQTLDAKLDWTERLGDAFIGQQSQVMDTVQALRQKAMAAGNLNSNAQEQVTQSDGTIDIAAANPEIVYVPYYDPAIVYGPWWWPLYPPIFWAPWGGYDWNGGFAWGFGIGIGADLFFGSWDWRGHRVYRRPRSPGGGQPWAHDPGHRRGVPYRSAAMNQQFGRAVASAPSRADFRGHPAPATGVGGGQSRGGVQSRPGASAAPVPRSRVSGAQSGGGVQSRPGASAAPAPRSRVGAPDGLRMHALDNVGRGAATQGFSARGHASMPARSAPPSSSRGASRPAHR